MEEKHSERSFLDDNQESLDNWLDSFGEYELVSEKYDKDAGVLDDNDVLDVDVYEDMTREYEE